MVFHRQRLLGKDCWSAVIGIVLILLLLFAMPFLGLAAFSGFVSPTLSCKDSVTGTMVTPFSVWYLPSNQVLTS